MKYIDPNLGVPLPERDYGGNCLIYDPGNTTDPFHNIWVRVLNMLCGSDSEPSSSLLDRQNQECVGVGRNVKKTTCITKT